MSACCSHLAEYINVAVCQHIFTHSHTRAPTEWVWPHRISCCKLRVQESIKNFQKFFFLPSFSSGQQSKATKPSTLGTQQNKNLFLTKFWSESWWKKARKMDRIGVSAILRLLKLVDVGANSARCGWKNKISHLLTLYVVPTYWLYAASNWKWHADLTFVHFFSLALRPCLVWLKAQLCANDLTL